MANYEDYTEDNEDPLAGDVDRWVHPDETRTDEQIARDEDVKSHLHMTGAGDSDDCWADYDELYGEETDETEEV